MERDECPICTCELDGTLATLGCCKKIMHVECLVKCMKVKLSCPMCRAAHENLRMVQDVESQILVPVPVPVSVRNSHFFRDVFACSFCITIVILSTTHYG